MIDLTEEEEIFVSEFIAGLTEAAAEQPFDQYVDAYLNKASAQPKTSANREK